MLSDLFKPYSCTITRSGGNEVTIASYRLKCSAINLDLSFNWWTQDSLEIILKGKVERLFAVFSNGGRLKHGVIYNKDTLLGFIEANYVYLTPDAKLNTILEYISSRTTFDGEKLQMQTPHPIFITQMYFHNAREWRFYVDSAVAQSLVVKQQMSQLEPEASVKYTYALTVNGLTRLINITQGDNSIYAFIAMAFTDDMFQVLAEAIKPALAETAFKAIIVSEEHVDSDKTINDAILAGIKKAKFTIADFTHHRGGVYFEAGYALGRNQKVIYTCRHDHMKDAHFDIRNYQHIVWTDASDLKDKLINKIEAFIKD